MGYVYQGGKLCCDICGEPGAQRKRCPHNYCPAIACCNGDGCKSKLKDYRQEVCKGKCKAAHALHVATEDDRVNKLAAGLFLRCAAVGVGDAGMVRVWFRNKDGVERVRYMHQDTYHSLPIGFSIDANVTEDDYRKFGEVFDIGEAIAS